MMQALGIKRIDQGLEYMLLANSICKVFGPPFAGKDEITHRLSAACEAGSERTSVS